MISAGQGSSEPNPTSPTGFPPRCLSRATKSFSYLGYAAILHQFLDQLTSCRSKFQPIYRHHECQAVYTLCSISMSWELASYTFPMYYHFYCTKVTWYGRWVSDPHLTICCTRRPPAYWARMIRNRYLFLGNPPMVITVPLSMLWSAAASQITFFFLRCGSRWFVDIDQSRLIFSR